LEEKNFCPLMTQSAPSRVAVVSKTPGSAPPCGSVMEKQETMSPDSSGSRYLAFCSSVPKWARISALPVSGACVPKIRGPQTDLPRISFSIASLSWP
jgi:hypothetical protein